MKPSGNLLHRHEGNRYFIGLRQGDLEVEMRVTDLGILIQLSTQQLLHGERVFERRRIASKFCQQICSG